MTFDRPKLNSSIYLVSFIAALAGLLFGFDTGIISGALLFIEQDFTLDTAAKELIVSSVLIGAMIGSLSSGRLTDKLGRRKVMFIIAAFFIVGTLVASLAPDYQTIIMGRVLIGIAIGIGSYTAPLYIAEAAPAKWRGGLVSINQLAITFGILSSFIISYVFIEDVHSWRWMFLIGIIPAVLLGMGMAFLPESPRWLIKDNKIDQAKSTLQYLRGTDNVINEINEIKDSLKLKEASFSEIFSPWIRHVLFLGVFLGFLQQVTGINAIIYYAPTIFRLAGFASTANAIVATIGIGIVNVLATVIAIFVIDKLGRRPLLFFGLIAMGLSLLVLSFAFHYDLGAGYLRWFAVVSIFVYIIGFAIGLGALLWLMISEIFPLEVRGTAMSVAVFSCWFWNFVVSSTFLTLVHSLGPSQTFLLYTLMAGIGFIISYYFVPETKGVSLETIEQNIRAKLPLRKLGLS